MMWREMTDRLIESDSELSAWRTALTVRYIVNSWNDAHDTPISEDAVLLFLCDETKGDLTEEQRAFAKMRREEIQSGIRRMICEWLLYDSMVPQGCAGDFRQFHRRLRPPRPYFSSRFWVFHFSSIPSASASWCRWYASTTCWMGRMV